MAVHLRPARPGDAGGIARVHIASWQRAYRHVFPAQYLAALSVQQREERWLLALTQGTHAIVVAEDDDAIVGFVAAGASRDEDVPEGRVGELLTIYVTPRSWGTGIGRRLHDAAIQSLADGGYAEATLWVLDSNQRARGFYERRGWSPDGAVKHGERGGSAITELRYRRDVKRPPGQ
jgi:ribosomal protein S18 acetylase RimI-like enzyme